MLFKAGNVKMLAYDCLTLMPPVSPTVGIVIKTDEGGRAIGIGRKLAFIFTLTSVETNIQD
jgi:hypothetical protein